MLIPLQRRKTPFHPPLAKGGFVVSLFGKEGLKEILIVKAPQIA
jgi:prepilin signal peptidase PulO-like enzyme (type II secretory pathway)